MKSLHSAGLWLVCAGLLLLANATPAAAGLGGDASSVQSDATHMKAALRSTAKQAYTLHEMRTDSGTVVREYVSPAGKVFGVAWEGRTLPDMQKVLGAYYSRLANASPMRRPQGPVTINEAGLVLQSSGHMGSFTGRAYVSEMLPEGVRADAIQ